MSVSSGVEQKEQKNTEKQIRRQRRKRKQRRTGQFFSGRRSNLPGLEQQQESISAGEGSNLGETGSIHNYPDKPGKYRRRTRDSQQGPVVQK